MSSTRRENYNIHIYRSRKNLWNLLCFALTRHQDRSRAYWVLFFCVNGNSLKEWMNLQITHAVYMSTVWNTRYFWLRVASSTIFLVSLFPCNKDQYQCRTFCKAQVRRGLVPKCQDVPTAVASSRPLEKHYPILVIRSVAVTIFAVTLLLSAMWCPLLM